MRPTPLQYLMQQLAFKTGDYAALSDKDKDDLKVWATEEMDFLGMK
jgi:hypothetical protein